VSIPVIVAHDAGCRFAREENGGHSDAAKRLADAFNLHKILGQSRGWIAFSLQDGSTDDTIYQSRADAVSHQRHNEKWRGYIELSAPSMSVCEAASALRWQRHTTRLAPADRDQAGGGLVVIPRLSIEGRERQIAAIDGRSGLPLALGRKR
jgi:hypothetical protein